MLDPREFVYRLDAGDRIAYVNDAWGAFAAENGRPDLRERALGSSLWDHVSGSEVRQLWRLLLARARTSLRPAEVSFRCDAPEVRRTLVMALLPAADGGVELRARVVRAEPRAPVALLAQRAAELSDPLVVVCSWCNGVRVEEDWVELEEGVRRLKLFEGDAVPRISHGLCPACKAQLVAEVGQLEPGGAGGRVE